MKDYQIQAVKMNYPKGTRVELENMSGEPQMPQGLQGTVEFVDDAGQIHVAWKNGSSLALVPGEDSFRKIEQEQNKQGFENEIRIHDELLIEDDHINAIIETWFDVNERFSLKLSNGDSLDLFADYYPADERLDVNYIIKHADDRDDEVVNVHDMTDAERDSILKLMHDSGLDDCVREMNQPEQAPENTEGMEMTMQ